MRKALTALMADTWAILPTKLEAIIEVLDRKKVINSAYAVEQRQPEMVRTVGVLPLYGVTQQRGSFLLDIFGGTSTDLFGRAFDRMVADPAVAAIVLDVDSPGGEVYGVDELSRKIFEARGSKPIVAIANSWMASAAYWIASSADEIVIVPGGAVGSIGTLAVHVDTSAADEANGLKYTVIHAGRHKAEDDPHEPLSEDAAAFIQKRVDEYYAMFVNAVARNRGVPASAIRSGYGQGRVVGAKEAVKVGLADRIATLDETIARVAKGRSRRRTVALAERVLDIP